MPEDVGCGARGQAGFVQDRRYGTATTATILHSTATFLTNQGLLPRAIPLHERAPPTASGSSAVTTR